MPLLLFVDILESMIVLFEDEWSLTPLLWFEVILLLEMVLLVEKAKEMPSQLLDMSLPEMMLSFDGEAALIPSLLFDILLLEIVLLDAPCILMPS